MPADFTSDFRLYPSNALELLAALLADELRRPVPGQGLLAPDTVLIYEQTSLGDEVASMLEPLVQPEDELLSQDDAESIAIMLEPNSSAALLLFENAWAARFTQAVRNANGEVIMNARIPSAVIDAVATPDDVLALQRAVEEVHVAPALGHYLEHRLTLGHRLSDIKVPVLIPYGVSTVAGWRERGMRSHLPRSAARAVRARVSGVRELGYPYRAGLACR